jgi:hypothetical protein
MKSKGFTYIIVTIILIMSITGVLILNNQKQVSQTDYKQEMLASNFNNEFEVLLNSDLSEETIDEKLLNIYNYIKSHSQEVKFCTIIEDENCFYFSNYTGNTCNLIKDEEIINQVANKNTLKTDRFINNTNIYLCNCTYIDISGYYLNIYNNKNQITQLKN